jgi:hypothetical protein
MSKAILLVLSATLLVFSAAPSFAINDRNNEPICSQPGNVDPRCY